MSRFKGVLLDWRGTLAMPPLYRQWVKTALDRLGRQTTTEAIDAVLTSLRAADRSALDTSYIDTGTAVHRSAYYEWFRAAGLDEPLADSLYAVESDASMNHFAEDAELLLATLHEAGVRIGIVSDIHFDIRPCFADRRTTRGTRWSEFIHTWVLSYELGIAKPDPSVFAVALERLGFTAEEVLMVGDRAGWDGAAAEVGITTLLLPQLRAVSERRLHRVLDLTVPGWSGSV
ncbi:HAD family hydrolase [Streptosporangium sp. NPDC000396]|uniref:HAD family hydrolase n=1 Tax=Streptosporangium sp. NPDC000396 TaxID=3366185 RepID=UPI0036B5225B